MTVGEGTPLTTDPLVKQLHASRLMANRDQVTTFETTLASIAAARDAMRYLEDLHLVFDDATEHEEVMYGLVHYLESCDVDEQLRAFVEAMPKMVDRAPGWIRTLTGRVLGDDAARARLRELLRSSSSAGASHARSVLREIANEESPPLCEYAKETLGTR